LFENFREKIDRALSLQIIYLTALFTTKLCFAGKQDAESKNESSRQLKHRIMKEKKKGAGKRLKMSKENLKEKLINTM